MLTRPFAAALLLAATTVAQADERKELARLLGEDPFVSLAAIGALPTQQAHERASELGDRITTDVELRLLRVGLGAEEERVVFGAVMLLDSRQLPLAELRNAAARTAPRLGDADCPVTVAELKAVWGSVDVPAVIQRVAKLNPVEAEYCLGELHRVVRAEHVPALCELALASSGIVRRAALSNAALTSRYSGDHGPLVITTWAKCADVAIDGGDTGRLPSALRAALQWVLDNPPPDTDEARNVDRTLRPQPPLLSRWLMASTAGAQDLPLLTRLIDGGPFGLEAIAALGHLRDDESLRMLREHAGGDDLDRRRNAMMALARRGDAAALDALLDGPGDFLACGVHVASEQRLAAFASHVLALPPDDATAALQRVQDALTEVFSPDVPAVDEARFAAFEPLAAAAKDLDARVLRTLVAVVPACATTRLADALLARPASELFAAAGSLAQPWSQPHGDLGFRGPWPFLEVTRPDAFRMRLRQGLGSDDEAVHATCADVLSWLQDEPSVASLLTWVQHHGHDERWPDLAACGGDDVRNALFERIAKVKEQEHHLRVELLRALGLLHGMPRQVAESWEIPYDDCATALSHLRDRDAVAAFLECQSNLADSLFDGEALATLLAWRDPSIATYVRQTTEAPAADIATQARWRMDLGLHRKDQATIRALREVALDGRYATHEFHARHLGPLRDLTMLSLWIDELGANCCRRVVADEALTAMFGEEPEHGDADNESVAHRLRRRLLPLRDRLRWSQLANGFVVAGI